MRHAIVTAAGIAGFALLLGASGSAAIDEAAPLCLGKPATLTDEDVSVHGFLEGTQGADVIAVDAHVEIDARGEDDLVCAPRASEVSGGQGDDRLLGGNRFDDLYGNAGDDELIGEASGDQLEGGSGHDRIEGGVGDDHLIGSAGEDELVAQAGRDFLEGRGGADRLNGGTDRDECRGGGQADTAVNCERESEVP